MQVGATYNKGKEDERKVEVEFNFGSTVEEAAKLFTGEAVLAGFVAGAKVSLQDYLRRLCAEGKTDKEIQSAVAEWKPGTHIGRAKKSKQEKLLADYQKMTPEQQEAFIAQLQEKVKGK